jgi:hypothetical protein
MKDILNENPPDKMLLLDSILPNSVPKIIIIKNFFVLLTPSRIINILFVILIPESLSHHWKAC